MVGAAVAEELVRLVAGREPEQLMAEADPEHGDAPEQLAHDRDLLAQRLQVAGAVQRRTASCRASSSAGVVEGTTVTCAPAPASRRAEVERLQP